MTSEPGFRFGRPRLLVPPDPTVLATLPTGIFQPLPTAPGAAPFHLELADVIGAAAVEAIQAKGELSFHLVGDTGGVENPVPQQNVALALERDLDPAADTAFDPSFLYLLGDCVYFNGDESAYYAQFYEPYTHYSRPIFAIPGNHDGDPLAGQQTLNGFLQNFCTPTPQTNPQAGDSGRTTMTQPNVHWTLDTPFATIVGLYTNVPEYGQLDSTQTAWLHSELAAAPTDRALLVTMHHPPYSADDFHSSSTYMQGILDAAMTATGRVPDLICAGHVHDYQRFTRATAPVAGSGPLTYLVAGAGGYHNLHTIAANVASQQLPTPFPGTPGVTIESTNDDHYGYLRLTISPTTITGQYVEVSPPPGVAPTAITPTMHEQFTVPVRAKTPT